MSSSGNRGSGRINWKALLVSSDALSTSATAKAICPTIERPRRFLRTEPRTPPAESFISPAMSHRDNHCAGRSPNSSVATRQKPSVATRTRTFKLGLKHRNSAS